MAEFLIAAFDRPGKGYKTGNIIAVNPDGQIWGDEETLPRYWIIKVPSMSQTAARGVRGPLYEPALPGDTEFEATDIPDRRILRAKGEVTVHVNELPPPKQADLAAAGITELTFGQAQAAFRRNVWNRGLDRAEDVGLRVF